MLSDAVDGRNVAPGAGTFLRRDHRSQICGPKRLKAFSSGTDKIDESACHVQACELDLDLVAHIDVFVSRQELALDRGLQQTDPGSLFRSAGDQSIEGL